MNRELFVTVIGAHRTRVIESWLAAEGCSRLDYAGPLVADAKAQRLRVELEKAIVHRTLSAKHGAAAPRSYVSLLLALTESLGAGPGLMTDTLWLVTVDFLLHERKEHDLSEGLAALSARMDSAEQVLLNI